MKAKLTIEEIEKFRSASAALTRYLGNTGASTGALTIKQRFDGLQVPELGEIGKAIFTIHKIAEKLGQAEVTVA